RNLLNFQRSWRGSREAAWAQYEESPFAPAPKQVRSPNPLPPPPEPPGNPEFAPRRGQLAAIKDDVIEHLPDYLDRFQRVAEANGVHVHRAADAAEANRYVLDLCPRH